MDEIDKLHQTIAGQGKAIQRAHELKAHTDRIINDFELCKNDLSRCSDNNKGLADELKSTQ